jgi:hypothetical protein
LEVGTYLTSAFTGVVRLHEEVLGTKTVIRDPAADKDQKVK